MADYFQAPPQSVRLSNYFWPRVMMVMVAASMTLMIDLARAQAADGAGGTGEIRIVEAQGTVELMPADTQQWLPARTNQVVQVADKLRTGINSRVTLLWYDHSVVPCGALSEIEILPPPGQGDLPGLHILKGIFSFFHRDKPGRVRVLTHGDTTASIEGTEFVVARTGPPGREQTTFSVVDGTVRLHNAQGTLVLTNDEQAVVETAQAPAPTAGFNANNLLQWCFYYPAVLDLHDLSFSSAEQEALGSSLAAYRAGDLLAALARCPAPQPADGAAQRLYHAALLLSVGQVEATESELADLAKTGPDDRITRLAEALRTLIAAVKRQTKPGQLTPELPTELLAASYYEQSRALGDKSLMVALQLARRATLLSPDFGFAWSRVAELEFCFGRTEDTAAALAVSFKLAPRNAQALALQGFVLSAQNQLPAAIDWFNRALAVDAAQGNAWLGRGLGRIRRGDAAGGREDLLVAAALEPQRAELRSYLGKALIAGGDKSRAARELALAKHLDPKDPTAWLYSALLNQENNQINDAIRDLEKSEELNNNRRVYRSQLLLDEDQAVRSANLAQVYQDDGLEDLSVREAGRAVSSDYGNYSAHLFLANSYDQLRDPNWSNLRYDAPASDEYWIANLLAPTGAGWLTDVMAERPNTQLFDQPGFGVVSDTTYLSRGAWVQNSDQYYTSDPISADVGLYYHTDPGQRPNENFETKEVAVNLKGQLTPKDSLSGSVQFVTANYGDTSEYYNQASASPDFQVQENQTPNAFLGYHRDWSPGVHTLFLAGLQNIEESASTTNATQDIAYLDTATGDYYSLQKFFGNTENYTVSPKIYSAELQQIWEGAAHTTIVGSRLEWGNVQYQNFDASVNAGYPFNALFVNWDPLLTQDFTEDFQHYKIYGYHTWQIRDPLALTAGLTYDWEVQPSDPASVPFVQETSTISQLSPKGGFIWTPAPGTIVRGAYTSSLSGFASGQNNQLEPTEVAGFNQAFRSVVPESVAGETSGSRINTWDLAVEQQFSTGTYLALTGQILYAKNQRQQGAFDFYYDPSLPAPPDNVTYPNGLNQSLKYCEPSITFTADQLLGKQWSVGANYTFSQAILNLNYVDINPAELVSPDPTFYASQRLNSVLQTINLHANWNHPSGLFSQLAANWYDQQNSGFASPEPGQQFTQINAFAGYRFWRRRAEITVGLLNAFDQNYSLEPLNLYDEMARGRTLLTRLVVSF